MDISSFLKHYSGDTANGEQQRVNVSEDAVQDDDNIIEQANEHAEAGRDHDRIEAEHDSNEQKQAASVTEHSEKQQTAASTTVWNRQQQQSQRLTAKPDRTQLELFNPFLDQQVKLWQCAPDHEMDS